jgi:stage II sporulation protein D
VRCRLLLLVFCSISACAQTVRIGVFTLFHATQLEIRPTESSPLLLTVGPTQLILNGEPGHSKALVRSANSLLFLDAQSASTITVTSRDGAPADFVISIPGKISRRYQGILTVTADARQLIPVVSMDIETATASIVAAESAPEASMEALKAQAVVARSFLYAGHRHHGYDFCDTTHCQFLRQPPTLDSLAFKATAATHGLILTWHHQPLAAMYSSRCGGRTASLREIGIPSSGYPYFSVPCAYCGRHPVRWTRMLSRTEADQLTGPSEQQRLALGREYGWSAVPGNHYSRRPLMNGTILSGEGAGHGVGLCQYGASGMAGEGATYATILRHYYPETELAGIPSLNTQP